MRARIPKKEREYFIENISMLLLSGMSVTAALSAIEEEIQSRRGKKSIDRMKQGLLDGFTLSHVLSREQILSESGIALIRLGETSGTLAKSIQMVAIEEGKERIFRARIRSAMIYPMFILILSVLVGFGIAWFMLPKLATIFNQMRIPLPSITRALISAGVFLQTNGIIYIPLIIGIGLVLVYFIFIFSKTKRVGEYIILHTPGVSKFIKEIQIARFGSTLGTLLSAGLPISDAIRALQDSSFFVRYKTLFNRLEIGIFEGKTISAVIHESKGAYMLIPRPVTQMIRAGEQSGSLPESLQNIGRIFEAKTEISTKNFAVLIEPVLLVLVWFGVLFVALAVFLPLYSLLGGLK